MKKLFLVMFIIAIAMMGVVSAAVSTTPPMGAEKGYYAVNSDPAQGSVLLDGAYYGLTPYTITVYPTGAAGHTISVSKSG